MNYGAKHVGANAVQSRYGVTDRTIHRWLKDTTLQFPKPLVINRRRYWNLAELADWEAARAAPHRHLEAAK